MKSVKSIKVYGRVTSLNVQKVLWTLGEVKVLETVFNCFHFASFEVGQEFTIVPTSGIMGNKLFSSTPCTLIALTSIRAR